MSGRAVEVELEEVVAWCRRTGRGLGKGSEGAGILKGLFTGQAPVGPKAKASKPSLPAESPSVPVAAPELAVLPPIDEDRSREGQIAAVRDLAWQAAELALRGVYKRIAAGQFEPSARDIKALSDAALAIEKRARPEQDGSSLQGLTLLELASRAQDAMREQWDLAGSDEDGGDEDSGDEE